MLLLVMPASPVGVPVRVLTALLLIQLLIKTPGMAADDEPHVWASAAHVEFLASGFSLMWYHLLLSFGECHSDVQMIKPPVNNNENMTVRHYKEGLPCAVSLEIMRLQGAPSSDHALSWLQLLQIFSNTVCFLVHEP